MDSNALNGWLDSWLPEDAALTAARARSAEVGVPLPPEAMD